MFGHSCLADSGGSLWNCGIVLLLQWIISSLSAASHRSTLRPCALQWTRLFGRFPFVLASSFPVQPGEVGWPQIEEKTMQNSASIIPPKRFQVPTEANRRFYMTWSKVHSHTKDCTLQMWDKWAQVIALQAVVFTLPGALGGVLFVFAALFSFVAIPRAGLATAQAVWSPMPLFRK